jgi:hypothetical protein
VLRREGGELLIERVECAVIAFAFVFEQPRLFTHDIAGFEQQVDDVGLGFELFFADAIENVLDAMHDFGKSRGAQQGAVAFDRMRGAKDRMQRFGIGRIRVESQQLRFHVREMLFGLLEEHRQEAGEVDGHLALDPVVSAGTLRAISA